MADRCGRSRLCRRTIGRLSKGNKQRVGLAAALLHDPPALFLDEPTIGLDVVAQHNIQEFLKRYQAERRTTVLLTSHYMKDIAALCRRVVIIAQGRLMYDGSLAGIVARFSGHKVLTVQFAEGEAIPDLSRYGETLDAAPPKARLRGERLLNDYQPPTMDVAVREALDAYVAQRKAAEPDSFM